MNFNIPQEKIKSNKISTVFLNLFFLSLVLMLRCPSFLPFSTLAFKTLPEAFRNVVNLLYHY